MKKKLPGTLEITDNIVNAWNHTPDEDRAAGRDWYEAGHTYLEGLAFGYDRTLPEVAGICAVLSPSVNWERNLIETHMVLEGETEGFTAYGANVTKAWDILNTGNLAVVRGPKVAAFYSLLVNPQADIVCVDTWAIRIALNLEGEVNGWNTRPKVEHLAHCYKLAACLLQEKASHVQAATWVHARAI